MSGIRVRCPGCHAGFRLAKPAEKVRCPKCETVFRSAESQVVPDVPARSPEPPVLKRTSWPKAGETNREAIQTDEDKRGYSLKQSGTAEDDGGEDDSGLATPRKSKSAKKKGRKSSRRSSSGFNLDKLTQFGWILVICGGLSFFLPAIGLQIKGLHRLSPETQTLGGVLFLLVGGLILAVVYGQQYLGQWFSDLPQRSKRNVVIVGGLVAAVALGVSWLVVDLRALAGMIPGRKADPIEAGVPNAFQPGPPDSGGLAGPGGPTRIPLPSRLPRPPEVTRPSRSQPQPNELGPQSVGPGGIVISPGIGGNPPRMAGQPPRIAGAPPGFSDVPSGTPGAPPGFPGPPGVPVSLEEQFAKFGPQRTVTVVLTGQLESLKYAEMMDRFRRIESGIQAGSGGGAGQTYTLRLAPVDDIQVFASKIDIGTVTQVNVATRVIEVKLP